MWVLRRRRVGKVRGRRNIGGSRRSLRTHDVRRWWVGQILAIFHLNGAISASDSLIIGGREVRIIWSASDWPNNDGTGDLACRTARLLNGVRGLLCNTTRA